MLEGPVGFHRTVPPYMGQVGEGVGGTGGIPQDCPTCPTWDIGFHGTPEGL